MFRTVTGEQALGFVPSDARGWAEALEPRLNRQRAHAEHFDAYYSGEHQLELANELFRDVFGTAPRSHERESERLLQLHHLHAPHVNLAAIGVDAVAERLIVDGFRVGSDDDQAGAAAARDWWLGNSLDVMSSIAHVESLAKGTAAALLWPGVDGQPVASIEDATQMVVHRRQAPPYDVDAALKVYRDEWTGADVALLWLPGRRYTLKAGDAEMINGVRSRWQIVEDVAGPAFVPVVELANRARLIRPPSSQIEHVAPLVDAHTLLLADMIVAADTGAFPIRTATGIKLVMGSDGEPRTPFDARADHAMVSENPDAKFGTLDAANLAGYVAALDMLLREIRTLTRVPEHYYGSGAAAGMS
ncbi:MAG: hypothetical protein JWR88_552, partial [Pseudonocardia sp.]|nr:hypothetical protein [Pseudonocardia sp.]